MNLSLEYKYFVLNEDNSKYSKGTILLNSSTKTVDSLMKLDLPAGVDIEIKT